jgi:hypothetical protein
MSEMRTIALIFAVGLLANLLFSMLFGGDEAPSSAPPSQATDDIILNQKDQVYPTEEMFESAMEFEDEVEHFEESHNDRIHVHDQGEVININQPKGGGQKSTVSVVNILYCIQ